MGVYVFMYSVCACHLRPSLREKGGKYIDLREVFPRFVYVCYASNRALSVELLLCILRKTSSKLVGIHLLLKRVFN